MNGAAIIMLGLVAFGTLHIKTGSFMPWQWYAFTSEWRVILDSFSNVAVFGVTKQACSTSGSYGSRRS